MTAESDLRPQIQNDDLIGDELSIDRIDGRDRINHLFEYRIGATCADGVSLTADDLLLKASSLVVFDAEGNELHRIFGTFSEIRDRTQPGAAHQRLELTLVPRVFSTTMRETLDVFMELTVPEIIEECLQRCGLEAGEHYDIDGLTTEYEAKEYVVQYRETDYAFISRLCEHYGIFFFVDHSQGKDILVFGDDNGAFPTLERTPEIPFRPFTSAGAEFMDRVGSVDVHTRPLPKRYTVRDYNYRIPGVDLLASADVDPDGLGEIVEYGAHFKGPNEGQWIADIRAQQLGSTKIRWHGAASAPCMQAGHKFMLTEHPQGDSELVLLDVSYHYPPRPHEDTPADELGTRFEAMFAETTYRPPRVTPKPRISGTITGVIQAGADDGYAELDDMGRYKVKLYFDTAERGEAQASRFVRMMQPHAGGGYGMHFPLRPGIEVLITHTDGDPDRPIIAGCVPNPETPSPVTAGNRDRNVVKTGGGNMIDISDEEGRQRFKFTTPTEGTVFQLGADNEAELGAVIKSSANVTKHAAETISNGSKLISEIGDFKKAVTGKNITAVAGIPNPIDGFDKIEKLVSSANKAVGSLNSLADSVGSFGKEMTDSHQAQAKKTKKDTEDAILKRSPEQKYPDDALRRDVGDPPLEVVETEAQFRARIVAERATAEEQATLDSATTQSSANVSMLGMYTLDDQDPWKDSGANKTLDAIQDVGGAAESVMGAVKPLFSGTHKKVQDAIDSAAWASAVAQGGDGVATITASAPRKSSKFRTPGEKYHLSWATDSIVCTGLQGAYLMSPLNTHVHGGSRATISGKGTVGVYSPLQAEMSSKRVYITSGILFDMESKNLSKMKSGKTMSFTSEDKLKMKSEADMFQETKASLMVKSKDLYDLDAGDEAKLKAKKWKFDSTEGEVDVTVKGDWSAAVEGGILWEHDKKARFYAKGDTALLRHNDGGNFTAKNNHARMSMKNGASLKVESSKATLDGKSTLTLKGSTIKANGKCLLG